MISSDRSLLSLDQVPDVVGDGANTDSDLLSVARFLHVAGQPGDGERRTVDLAHEESLEDDLVELCIRPPSQEPVQLNEQPQVDVLALGLSPADFTVLVMTDINSHHVFCKRRLSEKIDTDTGGGVWGVNGTKYYHKVFVLQRSSHHTCGVATVLLTLGLVWCVLCLAGHIGQTTPDIELSAHYSHTKILNVVFLQLPRVWTINKLH